MRWNAVGFKSSVALFAVVLAVGAAIATGSATPSAPQRSVAPAAESTGRALLDQFSQAFNQAASRVDRSVVAVINEQEVQATGFALGDPWNDDLLRRFFRGPERGPDAQPPATRKARSLGSGVIVSPDGYILTNHHVVGNSSKLTVELDGQHYGAQVVGTDPPTDLAVIKIDARDLPVASLGNSDELQVGQWVIAVGNPLELKHTVTAGIVSAKGRSSVGLAAYEDFIQTDASINPGNSGGALADLDGNVVGINTAIASPNGGNIGIGFAIPINMARQVMDGLIANGRISRGYLALKPQDVDEDLAAALGIEDRRGALVAEVTADGPAANAGVRRGDVIVSFNGQSVQDATQLRNLVASAKSGSEAQLEVVRDGRRRELAVKLGERPEPAEARASSRDGGRESEGHRLGLAVETLSEEQARRLGYDRAQGALVTEVAPGSPAEEAGIAPGDLILAVNRTEIRSVDELRRALASAGDRSRVALLVRRGERTAYVAVELS